MKNLFEKFIRGGINIYRKKPRLALAVVIVVSLLLTRAISCSLPTWQQRNPLVSIPSQKVLFSKTKKHFENHQYDLASIDINSFTSHFDDPELLKVADGHKDDIAKSKKKYQEYIINSIVEETNHLEHFDFEKYNVEAYHQINSMLEYMESHADLQCSNQFVAKDSIFVLINHYEALRGFQAQMYPRLRKELVYFLELESILRKKGIQYNYDTKSRTLIVQEKRFEAIKPVREHFKSLKFRLERLRFSKVQYGTKLECRDSMITKFVHSHKDDKFLKEECLTFETKIEDVAAR